MESLALFKKITERRGRKITFISATESCKETNYAPKSIKVYFGNKGQSCLLQMTNFLVQIRAFSTDIYISATPQNAEIHYITRFNKELDSIMGDAKTLREMEAAVTLVTKSQA